MAIASLAGNKVECPTSNNDKHIHSMASIPTTATPFRYQWFTRGDINGFFALSIDNLALLAGLIGVLIAALPESVVVPVLVFVGMEMSEQAAATTQPRHLKALGLALIPALAYLVNVELGGLHVDPATLDGHTQRTLQILTMLGNGFIITAMLWASWLIWVIDHRLVRAAGIAALCGVLTLVGLIHSPFADGRIFLPWQEGVPAQVFHLAIGYDLLALLCASLSLSNRARH